jgi:hypothetical protein
MRDELGDEVPLINEGGDIPGEDDPLGDPQDGFMFEEHEILLPPDPFPAPPQPTNPLDEGGGLIPVDPLPGNYLKHPHPPVEQP